MQRFIILVALIALCGNGTDTALTDLQAINFFKATLEPENYEKHIRPNYGAVPVEIKASMYIIHLFKFCARDKTIKASFYFRQQWTDPRLAFRGTGNVTAGADLLDHIWEPDTFFPDAEDGRIETTTVPNVFVKVGSDGSVLTSSRLTETLHCEAIFIGTLVCNLTAESYGSNMEEITYKWKNSKAVTGDMEKASAQFKLLSIDQYEKELSLSSGKYSQIGVKIALTGDLNERDAH